MLRLYVATENPSNKMKLIVVYIMKVYVPMWFTIKGNSASEIGALNMFKTIESSREMDETVQDIVFPVIQRNAFFAHPENVLLSIINDEQCHIR